MSIGLQKTFPSVYSIAPALSRCLISSPNSVPYVPAPSTLLFIPSFVPFKTVCPVLTSQFYVMSSINPCFLAYLPTLRSDCSAYPLSRDTYIRRGPFGCTCAHVIMGTHTPKTHKIEHLCTHCPRHLCSPTSTHPSTHALTPIRTQPLIDPCSHASIHPWTWRILNHVHIDPCTRAVIPNSPIQKCTHAPMSQSSMDSCQSHRHTMYRWSESMHVYKIYQWDRHIGAWAHRRSRVCVEGCRVVSDELNHPCTYALVHRCTEVHIQTLKHVRLYHYTHLDILNSSIRASAHAHMHTCADKIHLAPA